MDEPLQTEVFGWGNSHDGQLGLGSSETELFSEPQRVKFPVEFTSIVVQIATGRHHTLFVAANGELWSCGSDEFGQLGRNIETGRFRRPGKILALQDHHILQAVVGLDHSLALSDSGQIFSWGSNSSGQCGRESDEEGLRIPKLIKWLAHEFIIQIVAGNDFSLALSDVGNIFAWGGNSYGQLGLGYHDKTPKPTVVTALTGLPVKQVAASGFHSLILSCSGSVFSTGRNEFGQLGLSDIKDGWYPFPIKSLRNQQVSYICCGQEHSVALTMNGGVYTFGAGGTGQLGHGATGNVLVPRKVFELMGSPISQICAGRYHTMAYVGTSGKVYSFGLGASGQLGISSRINSLSPVASFNSPLQNGNTGNVRQLRELFAGGDQTFAVISVGQKSAVPAVDFCRERPLQTLPVFTASRVNHLIGLLSQLRDDEALLDAASLRELEVISGSLSCWNGSFLSFDHFSCGLKNSGVDLNQAVVSLQGLSAACKLRSRDIIAERLRHKLLPSLLHNPADIECLRIYLLLPLFSIFTEPLEVDKILEDIVPFVSAMSRLPKEPEKVIKSWFSISDLSIFETYIKLYKACLVGLLTMPRIGELIQHKKYWQGMQALLEALAILYDTNNRLRSDVVPLPCETFYIPEITDKVNIPMDYKNWYSAPEHIRSETLSFCNYPFAFDPPAKTLLLQADSTMQMEKAVNSMNQMDFIQNIMRAAQVGQVNISPQQIVFLNLYISRDNLLTDTLNQIWRFREDELKRPLKVWFVGEDAEDAGGVKKEFFMLLMRELMNPKYGMFTYYEETHSIYFNGRSFECDSMFGVIGVICGLAIYNATIVDVRFPLAVYKKLLGIKVTLQDIDGLSPTIRRGLEQLLAYDGDDFEEVFSLNFTISADYLGEVIVGELKPGGADIALTKANRAEYVDLYVEYMLNRAGKKQFEEFAKGFHRVCGGKILALFHPKELMAMVCGNENYDWKELQEFALYKGEYTADHPVIVMFWRVFHSLGEEEKKKFLMFLTGCDRIPILGMKSVRIVIQPMGDDSNRRHLPVAHTCFNILDLPRYQDEQILRDKLLLAMEQTQGFGLA